VSPFFHRGNPKQAQLTINFVDFIVSPIFNALKVVHPMYAPRVDTMLDILSARRESIKRDLNEDVERLQELEMKEEGSQLEAKKSPLPPMKSPNGESGKPFFARSGEKPRPCVSPVPLTKAQVKSRNRVARA
jgi:hypothetical protein